ncbi:hypothetical protein PNOK_0070200 [Pyrrhoderma noxium]|uniref:Secreted protein n=1 Tax=Pyrrhoderma noxium TaxID=2282107 RepID=A0A286UVQ7_9AGAM|nr:hypothetical protein PNOK_0070200 [Pyrrhoderma noxium]
MTTINLRIYFSFYLLPLINLFSFESTRVMQHTAMPERCAYFKLSKNAKLRQGNRVPGLRLTTPLLKKLTILMVGDMKRLSSLRSPRPKLFHAFITTTGAW